MTTGEARPGTARYVAELIADGGRSASGTDFFRCPEFLRAEEVTHTLLIRPVSAGSGPIASVPLVVREIPGSDRIDASSPYGYPGLTVNDGSPADILPLDPGEIDFAGTGLVTIFLRHSLARPLPLDGAERRNVCLLSDPELPRKSRASDRQQIRKNLKRGLTVEITPGPETTADQRAGFFRAYTETMTRTGAAPRYFFDQRYFEQILAADSTWLFTGRDPDGETAVGSIAARSDGLLHYYLSGTADAYLKGAPMKNVVEEMIGFGAERGLPVNLGGGLTPGDALEEFKRGFANREEPWFTSGIVCDRTASDELTRQLAPVGEPGFFPPYRA